MSQQAQAAAQQRIPLGKWAFKRWLTVLSPTVFGSQPIAEIPVDEASKAIGRSVEITLYDLTRDLTHINTKLKFRVYGIDGDRALTIFNGMEMTRDYVRNLVRRGSSKIMAIRDVTTKDGGKLRLEVMAITTYRCKRSHKMAIRKIIFDRLDKAGQEYDFDGLVKNIVMGTLSNELFGLAKKIYPLRKVEVVKVKVLAHPKGMAPEKAIEVVQQIPQQSQSQS